MNLNEPPRLHSVPDDRRAPKWIRVLAEIVAGAALVGALVVVFLVVYGLASVVFS